jgi:hypothetical protein
MLDPLFYRLVKILARRTASARVSVTTTAVRKGLEQKGLLELCANVLHACRGVVK